MTVCVSQRDWQGFLEVVDQSLTASGTDPELHIGEEAPIDASLVDVRTGAPVTLRHYCGAGPLLVVLMRHFA